MPAQSKLRLIQAVILKWLLLIIIILMIASVFSVLLIKTYARAGPLGAETGADMNDRYQHPSVEARIQGPADPADDHASRLLVSGCQLSPPPWSHNVLQLGQNPICGTARFARYFLMYFPNLGRCGHMSGLFSGLSAMATMRSAEQIA
jgi:hypothetical protein